MPDGPAPHARVAFVERDPPADAPTFARRVELHELDALQHVNNANYVAYLEQAALDAVSAVGWPLAAQLAAGGRLRAVGHDLEYLDSALYGDRILLTTWATAVGERRVERHTHVHRGNATRPLLRASSRYEWWCGDEAATLPPALRAALGAPDLRGSRPSDIVAAP